MSKLLLIAKACLVAHRAVRALWLSVEIGTKRAGDKTEKLGYKIREQTDTQSWNKYLGERGE